MYGNVYAALLCLRLLVKYLFRECNIKRSKADYYIFFRKYEKGNVELIMSVHMNYVFVAGNLEVSKYIKENIKGNSNI